MSRIGLGILGYGVGLVVAGSLFAGCGGISPGDYKVYRVAVTESELSTGCYPDKKVPYDVKSDSSSFRGTATFILYASAEDKFYLDVGKTTFEGAAEGDKYNFEGKTVDVNYTGPDGTGDKRTTTVTTTIEMTVDGAMVTGKQATKTSYKCSGQTCGQPIPSCTETIEFVGTEVEDVELDYAVEEGGTPGGNVSAGPTGGPSGSSGDPTSSGETTGVGGGSSSSSTGSGAGGSGGACTSCSDLLVSSTLPTDPPCDGSDVIISDMYSCGCGTDCIDSCSTMCSDGMPPDSSCQSCMGSFCSSQYSTCSSDF